MNCSQEAYAKTKIRALSTYQKGTKFDFWTNIRPGDIIEIKVRVLPNEDYPSFTNLRTDEKFSCSPTRRMHNYLWADTWRSSGPDGRIQWEVADDRLS